MSAELDVTDYEENANDDSMTPEEVATQIAKGGEEVIVKWHNAILKEPPTFDAFLEQVNTMKNRYPNVILYDRTRVKLVGAKLGDDYYHASYVDSYDRPDRYILAQAPFDEATESDFWRLIVQTGAKLIVLLTDLNNREGCRIIKHFWPESNATARSYPEANIKVNCTMSDATALYDWYKFSISHVVDKRVAVITVTMLHYRRWIYDKIIPDNLLEFRSEVDGSHSFHSSLFIFIENLSEATIVKWESRIARSDCTGPICLLCPTGVHRSGTYVTLDIVLDRVTVEKKVGLLETASIVRKQRYGCMSHYSHYSHVADLVVQYAVATGIVDAGRVNRKGRKV
ncbi:unnamed protein product [Litomosoides sigmodontis]|uniref:Tyrosine-protein phosphatase domain-containing protein n=1 Tax=Litomosoides sigmodontis TaxID=42156 RepID=A0A3P6SEB5_LITSI|nr:unnamed protein product [Litomosoides sigmodontis]